MMVDALKCKVGSKVEIDGDLFVVTSYLHGGTARQSANVRLKLKNIKTGRVIDRTYGSHDKINKAEFETRNMQYMYNDGEYHFMDLATFEQVALPLDMLGDAVDYLIEDNEYKVTYYKNEAVGIDLPTSVALEVVEVEPGVKGDTVSNVTKPATLQTGLVVNVPLFINQGEMIRIDTRTGEYVERA